MSTLEIILTAITTILGGGALWQLFVVKQTVRQAGISTNKSNMELAAESVTNMVATANTLMEQNKTLIQQLVEKNEEIIRLKGEKKDTIERLNALEKKFTKMISVIREVIEPLEKLQADPELISRLKKELDQ